MAKNEKDKQTTLLMMTKLMIFTFKKLKIL